MITRRETLTALTGAATLGFAAPDPLSGAALYADVVKYAGIGPHRTGSAADMATSQWIHDELAKAGLEAGYLKCAPRRVFDLKTCFVTVGEKRYQADPEWFPTATGPQGVTAELSLEPAPGKIWVLEDSRGGLQLDNAIKDRVNEAGRKGAAGAVVAIRTRSGELLGRPAVPEKLETPWCSVPLAGAAYKDRDALFEHARAGAKATLIIDGDDKKNVKPRNANGKFGSGKDLIVVTTPISAHTQSGGERGPGVALLLGLARWLGKREPKCRYLFSGNTGHETRGTGAYALLNTLPAPNGVKAWLHMGACISNWRTTPGLDREAVMRRSGLPNFVCAADLQAVLLKAFANIPDAKPRTSDAGGELTEYLRRGYRAFGFFGTNPVFHTFGDGPEQTGPELLEPVGRALARALELIEEMA
jgi:hypothetical protein